jgi:hypothetical protein
MSKKNLRKDIIRLAHTKKRTRPILLPLLEQHRGEELRKALIRLANSTQKMQPLLLPLLTGKKIQIAAVNWDKISDELAEYLDFDPEDMEVERTDRSRGPHTATISMGRKEWLVFKNDNDAEDWALDYLKEMFEDNPTMMNNTMLNKHVYVDKTTAHTLANEEADAYVESSSLSDSDLMSEAGLEGEWEETNEDEESKQFEAEEEVYELELKAAEADDQVFELEGLVLELEDRQAETNDLIPSLEGRDRKQVERDLKKIEKDLKRARKDHKKAQAEQKKAQKTYDKEAKDLEKFLKKLEKETESAREDLREKAVEAIRESHYDYVLNRIQDDLMGYLDDLGYDLERKVPNWVSINFEGAAEDVLNADGLGYTIASYDGEEIWLDSGALAFRMN